MAAWADPLTRQNHFVDVSDLAAEDGFVRFYVENQAVYEWAYAVGDEDPQVFERACSVGESWRPSGDGLADFVLHVVLFEAIFSGPGMTWDDIDSGQVDGIVAPLDLVAAVSWGWPGPGSRFWLKDGVLAFASANQSYDAPLTDASRWSLFVAARSDEDLDRFEGHLDPELGGRRSEY